MNRVFLFLLLVLSVNFSHTQNSPELDAEPTENHIYKRPKLVVGIVVDQMRYDYLTRYYDKYGDGGFKRLVREGFNCKNNHFNYIPTKTAPGHASVFTGTTPKYHGIIGNDWFDKDLGEEVYCVGDDSYNPIGTSNDKGKMSPHRMLATTFADENRLFTQMRGKTIGISIKDRGSVLPAGHTANAAYWYDENGLGDWITSSFYMTELPAWVKAFNASDATEKYYRVWNTLYNIETYTESGPDLNIFEEGFKGKDTPVFPYDLEALKAENNNAEIIIETPYGNSLTTDFSIAAIDGEQLGQDDITDVLTISYSSTDKVGHNFGVNAVETQDTYLRLDLDLERLLNALDEKVGAGNYTLFLTADHGAPFVPAYLSTRKIPAGLFDLNAMRATLNTEYLGKYQVENMILSTINNQVFLNHIAIAAAGLDINSLLEELRQRLLEYKLIDKVYIASEIIEKENLGDHEMLLNNGYNHKRSGDLMIIFNPSVFKDVPWNREGTDHGTGYAYDTHVPLLFFGQGIRQGSTVARTEIIDIAPTISALIGISFPNAATGNPIAEVLD